ncbi:MAG: Methyltransferase type 12 [Candidatus Roizmanbacteria bacterium GW2011_GWA2_34_18]|uniref:Methyltransferase type 12 n=1 Tax=Candidatus Roizmanbacteria bacterium GW2011_GWA2_34_18 TaxID=1618477 RepID=A0A0G0D9Y6_9BACT|nr:MAG: Methyltransferase type 12 [Candidatus Roizmanbacteria bacterium GW2011_GWA2_34_18]
MSVYGLSLIYSSFMGSPYVPTRNKVLLDILKEVKFQKGKLFVELGSGDARMIRIAVKKYHLNGLAVDINGLINLWAKILSKLDKTNKDIVYKTENIFDTNLTKADYLYLFLMPDLLKKLVPKFDQELKKGAIIISHGFPIKEYGKKLIKQVDRNPFPTYYYEK